jgi:hypothetical protein
MKTLKTFKNQKRVKTLTTRNKEFSDQEKLEEKYIPNIPGVHSQSRTLAINTCDEHCIQFIDIMPLFRYINNIKVINSLSSLYYKFFNAVRTLVNNKSK